MSIGVIIMHDKFIILSLTLMGCIGIAIGFDTDGYYLRQALLVLAGFCFGGVLFLFTESE
jgi:hypothetical protein